MSLYLTSYYSTINLIDKISSKVISKDEINNNIIFKYTFLYNSFDFYELFNPFHKDKYRIKDKFNSDDYNLFIKDLLISSIKGNSNHKFLCYCLIISKYIKDNYSYYINKFDKKVHYIERMIDSYLFNKFEKTNIKNYNLGDYFFLSFDISDDDLLYFDRSMKNYLGFFKSINYYKNCYNNAQHFFENYTGKKRLKIKIKAFLYDFFLNHKKGKKKVSNLIYDDKIDTTLLNINKDKFTYKDKFVDFNLDEFYNIIIKDLKSIIETLNVFFLTENIKLLTNIIK